MTRFLFFLLSLFLLECNLREIPSGQVDASIPDSAFEDWASPEITKLILPVDPEDIGVIALIFLLAFLQVLIIKAIS